MSKKPLPVSTSRGLLTVAIGGRERTLKFGMNTLAAYAELHTGSPGDFGTQFSKNPVQAMIDMTYCALYIKKNVNELPGPGESEDYPDGFCTGMVGDWIDEMAQEDWQSIQKTMMEAMVPGNSQKTK